ncbi:MAG TPA: hypothetical protein VNU68_09885 [Verrucomicrobiae bacterium]|nr:hypothetical protein [Verrucomicrobiae bacterium]
MNAMPNAETTLQIYGRPFRLEHLPSGAQALVACDGGEATEEQWREFCRRCASPPVHTYDTIKLASGEYGNLLMRQVADEYFRANPGCRFVLVHEHGGWFLGYRRDGSIWTTANDAAVLHKGQPFPTRFSGTTVRRTEKPA